MLVERLHLVVLAVGDEVDQGRVVERVDDRLGRAPGVDHDLDDGSTARAVLLADESLGDDAAQRLRERATDLLLLVGREEVDDAVDRLLRVDRVQRRHDEVAGLGCGQGGADRLGVAHLADEDDVGVLAHRGAQRDREVGRVVTHLALGDDRLLVRVQDLDRVLDRDDVDLLVGVDEVDQRGQGRRLAGAGGARDEHEATGLERELADHLGHTQLDERLGADGDAAEDQPGGPPRLVGVDAEPPDAGQRVGEVRLVRPGELHRERRGQHLGHHRRRVLRVQLGDLQATQATVHPQSRRRAHLAVQVGAAAGDQGVQERDDGLGRRGHP